MTQGDYLWRPSGVLQDCERLGGSKLPPICGRHWWTTTTNITQWARPLTQLLFSLVGYDLTNESVEGTDNGAQTVVRVSRCEQGHLSSRATYGCNKEARNHVQRRQAKVSVLVNSRRRIRLPGVSPEAAISSPRAMQKSLCASLDSLQVSTTQTSLEVGLSSGTRLTLRLR